MEWDLRRLFPPQQGASSSSSRRSSSHHSYYRDAKDTTSQGSIIFNIIVLNATFVGYAEERMSMSPAAIDFDNVISQVAEAQRLIVSPGKSIEVINDDLTERKREFLDLVGKLHNYFKDQLNPALVSTRKFEKATRCFIRALRRIAPMAPAGQFTTLGELENLITTWQPQTREEEEKNPSDVDRSVLQSFLKNINNFRILRQLVKMEILQTLKQLPEAHEDSLQTRTRGEMGVLMSAWTGLVNKDEDLVKLEHPSVEAFHEYFINDHERTCFTGFVSVLPKLTDIVNRFDYLLIKYQMGASSM